MRSRGSRSFVARRRGGAAFTMVEVMMSIVVLLTAITGILAFEHAIFRSNVAANDITAGTYIGEYWLERMRVESTMWTTVTGAELDATRTPLLFPVRPVLGIAGSTTGWLFVNGGAPVNRHLGAYPGAAGTSPDYAEFCVQYRLTVLVPGEILRVEVRTMWFKPGVSRPAPAAVWTCDTAGMLAGDNPDLELVNTVQLASTLRRNQVR